MFGKSLRDVEEVGGTFASVLGAGVRTCLGGFSEDWGRFFGRSREMFRGSKPNKKTIA